MKRGKSLENLSRDHHHALVLAQRIAKASDGLPFALLLVAVPEIFDCEIEPHFRMEEDCLLPPLEARGHVDLVRRTRLEHRELRDLARRIACGDRSALKPFGMKLKNHIRFEERELFVAAESVLPATSESPPVS